MCFLEQGQLLDEPATSILGLLIWALSNIGQAIPVSNFSQSSFVLGYRAIASSTSIRHKLSSRHTWSAPQAVGPLSHLLVFSTHRYPSLLRPFADSFSDCKVDFFGGFYVFFFCSPTNSYSPVIQLRIYSHFLPCWNLSSCTPPPPRLRRVSYLLDGSPSSVL